ncbi:MAG: DUF3301 domain-containing protein [Candidatus Sedimenticola sp. (ex Thyasira tokunagai)]
MSSLSILLLFGAIIWFWLDSARAREIATAICTRSCEQQGLQLLDQTVTLRRLGLRWPPQGVRIRRMFRFDYSEEGTSRLTGYIILIGVELEDFSFDRPVTTQSKADDGDKVVPLRRKPPES